MANRGQDESLAQNTEDDDQTWLDFLRSAGGTVRSSATAPSASHASTSATLPRPPISRNESTDRKRRLTSAEEGRNYPYNAPGTSRNSAIDLSTPPRQHPHQRGHTTGSVAFPPRRESRTSRRRASDIMPPPWQPDAEVHQCPVCEQEFGFLFRKHHCRKCGRVVCSNCSPHRITIPREYIVQPPGSLDGSPIMGGAEVVRVCKPCVPDPWTPPTPRNGTAATGAAGPRPLPGILARRQSRPWVPPNEFQSLPRPEVFPPYDDPRVVILNPNDPPPELPPPDYSHPLHPRNPVTGGRRQRGMTFPAPQAQSSTGPTSSTAHHMGPGNDRRASNTDDRQETPEFRRQPVRAVNNERQARSSAVSAFFSNQRGVSDARLEAAENARHHDQVCENNERQALRSAVPRLASDDRRDVEREEQRRRQLRDEDYCPVCGIEMPPGDEVREEHIATCVTSRFSTPPASTSTAANLGPIPPTNPNDPNLPSTLGSPAAADPATNSRSRAMSYRSRGMFPYIATEKDCVDSEGRESECTICMEEFLPGEELGRLECLCKFHLNCITGWGKVKGKGSCPIHVSNE